MHRFVFTLAATCLMGAQLSAQMTDNFNYADGPVSVVSGGVWERWDPVTSLDNVALNGALVLAPDGDNNRFFTDIFTTENRWGSICFQTNVSDGDTPKDYWFYFGPGSSPGVTGITYAEGVIFALDVVVSDGAGGTIPPDAGKMWVAAWDLAEDRFFAYGQVTEGAPHDMYVFILGHNPTTGRVDYQFLVDGTPMFTEHFTASAINAVEVYPTGVSTATGAVDHIVVIGNGDTNFDCCVDDGDVTNIILDFDTAGGTNGATDLDGSGLVDDTDLTIVILNYGQGCE